MKNIDRIYYKLYNYYGPQSWWPAESDLEMIIGSILVQNTNWNNVTRALDNFESFEVSYLVSLSLETLYDLIRPAGFYKRKAVTIQNILSWLNRYNFDFAHFDAIDTLTLRDELLDLNGIGAETCDCILLYALHRPIFVVDSYLRRVLVKLGFPEIKKYEDLQELMMTQLPNDTELFQEYHALIVAYGKEFLKTNEAHSDPLAEFLPVVNITLKNLYEIKDIPIMNGLIRELGFVERLAQTDPFDGVIDAIIGQLISTKAASAISKRFKTKFSSIEELSQASFTDIQSVGLTKAKTEYILNLIRGVKNGSVDLNAIWSMSDAEALATLLKLKGIGIWSAKIILIHVYGRLDFSMYEDVALRNAVKKMLRVDDINRNDFETYFDQFSPYKSIACIYHWRYSASHVSLI